MMPPEWEDMADVIGRLELRDISTGELRARLSADRSAEDDPDPEISLYVQETDEVLVVRARMSRLEARIGFVVDLAVRFDKNEAIELDSTEQARFIELIAMPTLYPFLRQHVQDLTARLGEPLLLPLIRLGRGSVRLADDSDEEPGVDLGDDVGGNS